MFRKPWIRTCAVSIVIRCLVAPPAAGAVDIGGVEVSPDRLIAYVFAGHSNMEGYCGEMDTVPHPRAWYYNLDRGFTPARDPIGNKRKAPSPVMPFLKAMAARYPGYYFCAAKVTQAGAPLVETFFPGKKQHGELLACVDSLRGKCVIGGVLAMFGFVEGISDSLSRRFGDDALTFISLIRRKVNTRDLPVIWGRYESNADSTHAMVKRYGVYGRRIQMHIDSLPAEDSMGRTALTPPEPVPAEYFCDNHHYDQIGYALWSRFAANEIGARGWDFWADTAPDTCAPHPPCSLFLVRGDPWSVSIGWHRAVDDVFVTGYRVWVNGRQSGETLGHDTTYTAWGLTPHESYDFTVRAIDRAGNRSEPSPMLTVKAEYDTLPVPATDTVSLLTPRGGQVYMESDTMTVRWTGTVSASEPMLLSISADSARSWETIPASPIVTGANKVRFPLAEVGKDYTRRLCFLKIETASSSAVSPGEWCLAPQESRLSRGNPRPAGKLRLLRRADTAFTVAGASRPGELRFLYVEDTPIVYGISSSEFDTFTVDGLAPDTRYRLTLCRLNAEWKPAGACDTLRAKTHGGGRHGAPLFLESPGIEDTPNCSDMIPVRWSYNPDSVESVMIEVSSDSGRTWDLPISTALPASRREYLWDPTTVPPRLSGKTFMLRLTDYGGRFETTSEILTCRGDLPVGIRGPHDGIVPNLRYRGKTLRAALPRDAVSGRLELYDLAGRRVLEIKLSASRPNAVLDLTHVANGVHSVRFVYVHNDWKGCRRMMLVRTR